MQHKTNTGANVDKVEIGISHTDHLNAYSY